MDPIKKITKNGFSLKTESDEYELTLALNSLKIGLKSYFNSHDAFRLKHNMDKTNSSNKDDSIDIISKSSYAEVFFTTIVNIQHFFELVLKFILRKENPIYALESLDDILIIDKLIHSEDVDDSNFNSINFRVALDRIDTLVNNDRIHFFNPDQLKKILDQKKSLEELNILRNRLWHRGLFILNYEAFDVFMIKYILPLVEDVFLIDDFKHYTYWKYNQLACKEDPIQLLIKEGKLAHENYDIKKIAVIKELGRAAYNNKIVGDSLVSRVYRIREINERIPNYNDLDKNNNGGVWDCPICSFHSFVENVSEADVDIVEKPFSRSISFLAEIKCLYCSFTIDREFNTNDLGLKIQKYDFWES